MSVPSPTLIVCGSGPEFFKDYQAAREIAGPDTHAMAINMTAFWVPRLEHMASLHAPLLGPLRALRGQTDWSTQGTTVVVTHSTQPHAGVDRVWPKRPGGHGGTSSLFGVRVGLALGYTRILLAGVPMDDGGRFFDPPWITSHWKHMHDHGPWEAAREEFAGRVTSLSGWTKDYFGSPT